MSLLSLLLRPRSFEERLEYVPITYSLEVLVVGAGGDGGLAGQNLAPLGAGGGGGGGEVLLSSAVVVSSETMRVFFSGGISYIQSPYISLNARRGGDGGNWNSAGSDGAYGGGGGVGRGGTSFAGGQSLAVVEGGQPGRQSAIFWAGGGGGAGQTISQGDPNIRAVGLDGLVSSITGESLTYGSGGGGGTWINTSTTGETPSGYPPYPGGSGSGSGGATDGSGLNGQNAAPHRGGGGGGAASDPYFLGSNGQGASGVVVIAYPDTLPEITVSGGLTYDQPTRSGYRVYRFTAGSGTITFP